MKTKHYEVEYFGSGVWYPSNLEPGPFPDIASAARAIARQLSDGSARPHDLYRAVEVTTEPSSQRLYFEFFHAGTWNSTSIAPVCTEADAACDALAYTLRDRVLYRFTPPITTKGKVTRKPV